MAADIDIHENKNNNRKDKKKDKKNTNRDKNINRNTVSIKIRFDDKEKKDIEAAAEIIIGMRNGYISRKKEYDRGAILLGEDNNNKENEYSFIMDNIGMYDNELKGIELTKTWFNEPIRLDQELFNTFFGYVGAKRMYWLNQCVEVNKMKNELIEDRNENKEDKKVAAELQNNIDECKEILNNCKKLFSVYHTIVIKMFIGVQEYCNRGMI